MAEVAIKAAHDARIQGLDEGAVQQVLRAHNPRAPIGELRTLARIVSIVVDVVSGLPKTERVELAREREPLRAVLQEATQSLGRTHVDDGREVERSRGTGLGELLSLDEGKARLDRYAVAKPIEEWAGPVAGAGDLETRFGIKRSTLNTWYRQDAVVGLLRGQRKLAYPLDQFIDARPLEGVRDILRLAPDPRSAWLWMRQTHGALDGRTPLDWLRDGKKDQVVEAARRDFVRETD